MNDLICGIKYVVIGLLFYVYIFEESLKQF